jgi:hypothetical protein
MNAHPEGMARIECRVDGDSRLIAGAAIIVAHVARRAGLANVAASDLADATVQTCRAVLDSIDETGSHAIRLSASELPNSIEISVEPLDGTAAHKPPSERSRLLADRVRQTLKASADGVNVKVQEELSRVTLVKNCGAAKHPFAV